ncbi:MAG: aminodeoxychorismate/anthranilate synthase component II [Marinifilaceae bacterium]
MRIYVLDNYDSFTFNLVHYVEMFCDDLKVVRNDKVDIDEIDNFDKILISPGPGLPSEQPILAAVLERYSGKKPILGVCLGMQAIAEFFGGSLYNLPSIVHGVPANTILIKDDYLFQGVATIFDSGRYHSWAVEKSNLPDSLEILAVDDKNVLMAIAHKEYDIRAVQFHPESVMTQYGNRMIKNWVKKLV